MISKHVGPYEIVERLALRRFGKLTVASSIVERRRAQGDPEGLTP